MTKQTIAKGTRKKKGGKKKRKNSRYKTIHNLPIRACRYVLVPNIRRYNLINMCRHAFSNKDCTSSNNLYLRT